MSAITARRLAAGFAAGFLSVLVFSMGAIALAQAAGAAVPFPAWSMAPTQPLGVPQTVSLAFFGGLWGVGYAAVEPWLTARLGWLPGGLLYGTILPLLGVWFIVFPLKGIPVSAGFTPHGLLQGVLLHAAFGLGLALFFRLIRRRGGRPARADSHG